MRPDIVLQNPNRYPEAAARRLRPWLEDLLAAVAPGTGSFGVRFASDRELARANRGFRGKEGPTDVLSFPGQPGEPSRPDQPGEAGEEGGHLGDVLISVPTARRQAAAAGHSTGRELRILLLHGVLHCLGHDHETDGGEMERLERRLRRTFLAAEPPDA
jgi:probable rRNA maturation factor